MVMDQDNKLKALAKDEKIRVPVGFDKRIDELADSLGGEKTKRRPRLRAAQVAAIVAAVCLLAGGTVYAGVNGWVIFGWDGEPKTEVGIEEAQGDGTGVEYNTTQSEEDVAVASVEIGNTEDYSALVEVLAPNEIYRVVSEESMESGGSDAEVYSWEEMKALLGNAMIPYVVPEAPEGYSFKRGFVQQGLSPELISPETQPTRTETLKDGRVFEVFTLPDGYERYIEYYVMEFADAGGNEIVCTAMPLEKGGQIGFGASQAGTAEKLSIPGFSQAVFINDESGELTHQHMVFAKKDMEDISYMDVFSLDYGKTAAGEMNAPFETQYYDAVVYDVSGTGASRELLVSMLEGVEQAA